MINKHLFEHRITNKMTTRIVRTTGGRTARQVHRWPCMSATFTHIRIPDDVPCTCTERVGACESASCRCERRVTDTPARPSILHRVFQKQVVQFQDSLPRIDEKHTIFEAM